LSSSCPRRTAAHRTEVFHPRIHPITTEMTIVSPDGHRLSASSIDVSSGGRSLKRSKDMPSGTNVEISLSRLSLPRVTIRAVVTWRKLKSNPPTNAAKNQAVDRHLPRNLVHET
jgi:hypothetical protein